MDISRLKKFRKRYTVQYFPVHINLIDHQEKEVMHCVNTMHVLSKSIAPLWGINTYFQWIERLVKRQNRVTYYKTLAQKL